MKFKIGFGYDIHQLSEKREFWLGGTKLDYHKGALGHSDADVLLHSIADAVLGAINQRDIGFHFSDKDPKYKDIDSKIILTEVINILHNNGYKLGNVDATVCLEKPKLSPHIPKMQEIIANICKVDISDISIKATTSEKMGFVGTEDGIKAYAVCLVYQD